MVSVVAFIVGNVTSIVEENNYQRKLRYIV